MSVELRASHQSVLVVKYRGPLSASEANQVVIDIASFAQAAALPVILIVDFTEITGFPVNLMSLGLRLGDINPVRNPKIEQIVGIARQPIISKMAAMVSSTIGTKKIIVVQTDVQADREIEAFLHKYEQRGE